MSFIRLPHLMILISFLSLSGLVHPQTPICIPFELINQKISLPIEVGGLETRAVISSGENFQAISTVLAEKLGLKANLGSGELRGAYGGTMALRLVDKLSVKFLGQDVELVKPILLPLNDGVGISLGTSIFTNNIVQINYPKSCIVFLPREALDLRKVANLKLRYGRNGEMLVKASINGNSQAWFRLITSAPGIFVDRGYAATIGLLRKESEQVPTQGLSEVVNLEQMRVEQVKFGPYELGNVLVKFPAEGVTSNLGYNTEASTGSFINRSADAKGVIGYDILKHFIVTIDYKGKRAHIAAPQ